MLPLEREREKTQATIIIIKLIVHHGANAQSWKGHALFGLPLQGDTSKLVEDFQSRVANHICKPAKKGLTPSRIDVILRDSHGIGQVKSVIGSKVLRILKGHGLGLEKPKDLYRLIKMAIVVRKHLERNHKDKDS